MSPHSPQQIRFGDDVAVGDELTEIVMRLTWTTMALQVSGSQDWNQPHHDPDFAAESGMPGIFYNTGWTTALLGRLLTDWAGREGWVERLALQMRGMHQNGDTVRAHGQVTAVTLDDDVYRVELALGLSNDRLGLATPATATVRLPRRSPASALDASTTNRADVRSRSTHGTGLDHEVVGSIINVSARTLRTSLRRIPRYTSG